VKRLASIDIGTNSVLLLVVEARTGDGRRRLVALEQRATITRLGEGVDRTGQLAEAARERTLECLKGYAERIAALGVDTVEVVATSAMRDAEGGPAFAREAEAVLGARPRIIAGREEAELTFLGAVSGLDVRGGSVCVFDIGGGSTEVIRADRRKGELVIVDSVSLDIGSVRLHERCLRSDPPTVHEYDEVVRVVDDALSAAPSFDHAPLLVGVAGTVTTLSAIELGLREYDAERVHGSKLSLDALTRLRETLWSMSLAERRSLPGLHPLRADVIVVGAVIAERIVRRVAADELVVSDRGVRWGLAERAL